MRLKRILSTIIAAVMVLSLIPAMPAAAIERPRDDFVWGDWHYIVYKMPMTGRDYTDFVRYTGTEAIVTIPSVITMPSIFGGTFTLHITGITGDVFSSNANVNTVIIPEVIEEIYGNPFQNCINLKTIIFKGSTPPTFTDSNAPFLNSPITTIYVPVGAKAAYQAVSQLSGFHILEGEGTQAAEVRVSNAAELAAAISSATGTRTIIVDNNIALNQTLTVANGNVTIKSGSGGLYTLTRNIEGALISVSSGATLTLENIIIDGSADIFPTNSATLIAVSGNFIMNNGVVLRNNNAISGGGVYVDSGGSFTMNGGEIINNKSSETPATNFDVGGSVFVGDNGVFTMNGGAINKNVHNGVEVLVHNGLFLWFGGSIDFAPESFSEEMFLIAGEKGIGFVAGASVTKTARGGLAIRWSVPSTTIPDWFIGRNTNLFTNYYLFDSAKAVWAVEDGKVRVNYEYGEKKGFIELPHVTIAGSNTPTVTGVTVSPATAQVQRGATQQFSATVQGTNNPAQTVTWKVEGNSHAGTTINASGLLTVHAEEATASSLKITATSTVNTAISRTATVTITAQTNNNNNNNNSGSGSSGGSGGGGGGGSTTPATTTATVTTGTATWTVTNIPRTALTALSLSADIPIRQLRIPTGATGNTSVSVGAAFAGQNAVLVKFNAASGALEFVSASTVGTNGNANVNVRETGDFLVLTFKTGDITGTGEVQTTDALALLRHVAGISELNSIQQYVANGKNGDVGTTDALNILRLVAGIIEKI